MPNPTSSSESGIPTGSDPSRGPPSWAGLRPDASALHPPGCSAYVTHRLRLVWSRQWKLEKRLSSRKYTSGFWLRSDR